MTAGWSPLSTHLATLERHGRDGEGADRARDGGDGAAEGEHCCNFLSRDTSVGEKATPRSPAKP